jgi:hypothetical protein
MGNRIAGGAAGAIFPVQRKIDSKFMIGKMITENEDSFINREMVENEIGIMMLNEGESIIECYDSIER